MAYYDMIRHGRLKGIHADRTQNSGYPDDRRWNHLDFAGSQRTARELYDRADAMGLPRRYHRCRRRGHHAVCAPGMRNVGKGIPLHERDTIEVAHIRLL